MEIKNIFIVTDAPMPIGMAPTNRILSYVKGFDANGIKSEIIIFRKTNKSNKIYDTKNEGIVDGIKYRYLFSSALKSSYFLKRRLDDLLGDLRLFLVAITDFKKDSVLIYYSSRSSPVFFLVLAKLFNRFVLLKEESEHPSVYKHTMNAFSLFVFSSIHYRFFDGYLLMTRNLMDYFSKRFPDKPSVLVPMTVDLIRFKNDYVKRKKSITYIGSLNNEKAGVDILLEACFQISNRFPDDFLNLYGEAINIETYNNYQSFVSKFNLTKRVFFKGRISGLKVPEVLSESGVLVLARPESLQAQNGFPTKLGEYLATGNPVVVTSVGEISDFLKDKDSAFIAQPGDVESLKDKIIEVLEDKDMAEKIGIKGRKVAEKYFNNITQTRKILEFINEL